MPKIRVLKPFKDTHTKELVEAGSIVEMTAKRYKEAVKNLAKYGSDFLEVVKNPNDDRTDEPEEE